MKSLKMQPTFSLDVPFSAEDAIMRFRQAIGKLEFREHTFSAGKCIDFKIEPADQRFWSPHLSVQLSDTESGSQLFGRFSPRPEIWTMVMAIYAVVTISVFASAIYGYVQWFMNGQPWALLWIPVGLVIIAGLHLASLLGQSLSCDQMERLRQRLDEVIQVALDVSETQN